MSLQNATFHCLGEPANKLGLDFSCNLINDYLSLIMSAGQRANEPGSAQLIRVRVRAPVEGGQGEGRVCGTAHAVI